MKYYHYYSNITYTFQKIAAIFFLLIIPVIIYGMLIKDILALELIILIVVFLLIGVLNLNMFPDVETSEKGIAISFFFIRKFIPWGDVVSIQQARFFGYSSLQVISCRKITLFHWFYGLTYGDRSSIYPSFLISSKISDYQSLISYITKRIEYLSD
jgi:hypothetical protein